MYRLPLKYKVPSPTKYASVNPYRDQYDYIKNKDQHEAYEAKRLRLEPLRPFTFSRYGTNFQLDVFGRNFFTDGTETPLTFLCNAASFYGTQTVDAGFTNVFPLDGQGYAPVVGAIIGVDAGVDVTVTDVKTNSDGSWNITLSQAFSVGTGVEFQLKHISYTMPRRNYVVGYNLLPQLLFPFPGEFLPGGNGLRTTTLGAKLEILDKDSNVLSTTQQTVDYSITDPIQNYTVTGASWSGGIATVTVSQAVTFVAGAGLNIEGINPSAYNGFAIVLSAGGNSFTYSLPLGADPGDWIDSGLVQDFNTIFKYEMTLNAYQTDTASFNTFSAIRCTPTGGDSIITGLLFDININLYMLRMEFVFSGDLKTPDPI